MTKRPIHFILDEQKKVIPTPDGDVIKWAEWWETNRFMADETVGGTRVVTIFLGVDQTFGFDDPPQYFESTVFGEPPTGGSRLQQSYATYEEAMAGHRELVELVRKQIQ